jgi:tRNA A37 threonylcarbamoyladenosine dehydratase
VEAVVSMCTADNIDTLLAGQPDFVLDAIDNIHTKVRGHSSQTASSISMLTPFYAENGAQLRRCETVSAPTSHKDPHV